MFVWERRPLNPGNKKRCHSNISCNASDGNTNTEVPPDCCKVRSKSDCVLESISKLSEEFVALQQEVIRIQKMSELMRSLSKAQDDIRADVFLLSVSVEGPTERPRRRCG